MRGLIKMSPRPGNTRLYWSGAEVCLWGSTCKWSKLSAWLCSNGIPVSTRVNVIRRCIRFMCVLNLPLQLQVCLLSAIGPRTLDFVFLFHLPKCRIGMVGSEEEEVWFLWGKSHLTENKVLPLSVQTVMRGLRGCVNSELVNYFQHYFQLLNLGILEKVFSKWHLSRY